jgi:hypothetical protein
MTRILIDNPITSAFAMVPNVLWTWPGLSFKAKGFFAYLLSHRDGSAPPVAAMEADTGIGRDARKGAMRELIAAGLARWVIQRDGSGRVLAKRLEVTTRPLLAAVAAGAHRATGNPSHGAQPAAAVDRATGNPSDGKPVAAATESRRLSARKPAILQNQIQKEGAPAQTPRLGARCASSRVETSRAPTETDKAGGVAPTDAAADAVEKRRALAAALGLPVIGADGRWCRPALAECGAAS